MKHEERNQIDQNNQLGLNQGMIASSNVLSSFSIAEGFQERFRKTFKTMFKGLQSLKQSLKFVRNEEQNIVEAKTRQQLTPTLNAHRPNDESQCGCMDIKSSSLFSNGPPSMDIKVLLLGASKVGKSTLCSQFIKGEFLEEYHPTIEDHFKKILEVDGIWYNLHILDTAGNVCLMEEKDDGESTSSTASTMDDETRVTVSQTTSSLPADNTSCSSLPTLCGESTVLYSSISPRELKNESEDTAANHVNNSSSNSSNNSSGFLHKCLRDSVISHISPRMKSKRTSLEPETIFASDVVIFLVYSISDHSSFESVVQLYEDLKQLIIESQLTKYFKEQECNEAKRSGSLRKYSSSSRGRSFNYSFQPTIMLVGTKLDHDTSVKSLSDLNTSLPNTCHMHGFYYGFGHSSSGSTYNLPSSLPIHGPTPISRRPSIYSQCEYSLCGVSETKREVSYEEGEQFQKSIGENCLFMEIAGSNSLEVEQIFLQAVRNVRTRTIELDNSDHAHAYRSSFIPLNKRPKLQFEK